MNVGLSASRLYAKLSELSRYVHQSDIFIKGLKYHRYPNIRLQISNREKHTHSNDVKSPIRANLGDKGITRRIFFSVVSDWSSLLAGKQWLGHFHQVVSALHNSFFSPLIPPSLYFSTHQLQCCLMSLQVQHALHPPLIHTWALASSFPFDTSSILFVRLPPAVSHNVLSSIPISPSILTLWHLSFILFLLFTWNVSLCLILSKSLT